MANASKSADKPAKTAKSAPKANPAAKKAGVAAQPAAAKKPAARKTPAAKKPVARSSAGAEAPSVPVLTPDQRRYYVEVAAFYIAERRGFHGGSEMDDWVQAEAEIDRLVREGILKP